MALTREETDLIAELDRVIDYFSKSKRKAPDKMALNRVQYNIFQRIQKKHTEKNTGLDLAAGMYRGIPIYQLPAVHP